MWEQVHIVRNAIPSELVKYMTCQFEMMENFIATCGNLQEFNDHTVGKNNFSWYCAITFESAMVYLHELMEEKIGKELYPSYSYGRIYGHKSYLNKHRDRRCSEWSASCCLSKDCDWPLNFEHEGEVRSIELEPGDLVVFPGSKITHWRDRYFGQKHIQMFLQYVEVDGEYSHFKYDTRPCLAAPYESTSQDIKDELNSFVYTEPNDGHN